VTFTIYRHGRRSRGINPVSGQCGMKTAGQARDGAPTADRGRLHDMQLRERMSLKIGYQTDK